MSATTPSSKRLIGKPCVKCGSTERYASGGCAVCHCRSSAAWKVANREKHLASLRARHRELRAKNDPRYLIAERRKRGYPEPTRLESKTCEMCGCPPGKRRLCLDHCHVTNSFRGWLCADCNIGLGRLGDSIDIAIERLMRYRAVTSGGSRA